MYSNLKAEMARKDITIKEIAEKMEKQPNTISAKITGKTDFTLSECLKIKTILQVEMPLEDLFSEE